MDGALQPLRPFDRDPDLGELVAEVGPRVLGDALAGLLGPFRLRGEGGQVVLERGDPGPGAAAAAVGDALEPLGRLEAAAPRARVAAAAGLLERMLRLAARYRMAADLYMETVRADYEALQAKHEALVASEARYRALAAELEQRVAEQVRTIETRQRQLYQAEKLAAVGQLAAGMAHEINNPIGYIRSNLRTAAAYLDEIAACVPGTEEGRLQALLDDFRDLIAESAQGAERIAAIVRDLRAFARVDRPERERVDPNELVRGVCNVVRPQLPEGVVLALRCGEVPELECHAGRLSQALLNIVLNALQAVGGQGRIEVETRAADGRILISVRDDGPGIAPEVLPRIFDPFFTTREVGAGTGLGLSVAMDVARAHGGTIEVESAPGRGACFTAVLPAGGG